MRWFGRKSARDAVRLPLSRAGSVALGEWPRSYEAQIREGYCQNPVAQRAVRLVAEGVASAALTGSDPALVALVAARSGGQALTETLAAQMLLHGRAWRCSILRRKVARSLRARTCRPAIPPPAIAGSWEMRPAMLGPGVPGRSRAGRRPAGASSNPLRECASGSSRTEPSRCFRKGNGGAGGAMAGCSSTMFRWSAHGGRRSRNPRAGQ
jgi:hypothetical protein